MNLIDKILRESKLNEIIRIPNNSATTDLSDMSIEELNSFLEDSNFKFLDKINNIEILFENESSKMIHLYFRNEGNFIGHILLKKFDVFNKEINKVILVEIFKYYKGKGIAKLLYDYLINKFGIISSDTQQSKSGAKIWESLINSGKYKILVYNDNKKKIYYHSEKIKVFTGAPNVYLLACKTVPIEFKKLLDNENI